MTASGQFGVATASDIWSINLSLAAVDPSVAAQALNFGPDDTVFDDMAADVIAWFRRPTSHIANNCKITKVKFAFIGADGRYTKAPVEKDGGGYQGGQGAGPYHPYQCALAVTLGTDGDLGRVKGRFFSPAPAHDIDPDTGLISVQAQTDCRNSADQLLTDLGNQPGLDALDIRVCVASQGRHNKDGSVRTQPGNYPVVRVNVGRVIDTMRSRRSALPESPIYAGVTQ